MGRAWLVLAACLFLAVPSAGSAQPPSASDPAAVLRQVELAMPARLCGLEQRAFGAHSQTGSGVHATYAGTDAWIDIFILPVTRPLDEEFAESAEITQRLTPGLSEVGDFAPPPGVAGARGRIWRGERRGEALLTGMLAWHRGGWRIKILASAYPDRGGPGWTGVECAIRALGGSPSTI